MADIWSYTVNFALNDASFRLPSYPGGPPGEYVLGVGWRSLCKPLLGGPGYYDAVQVTRPFNSITLIDIQVHYDNNFQSLINNDKNDVGVNALVSETPYRVTNGIMHWSGLFENVISMGMTVLAYNSTIPSCAGSNGNALIKAVSLVGLGVNPFVPAVGCEACQLGVFAGIDIEEALEFTHMVRR